MTALPSAAMLSCMSDRCEKAVGKRLRAIMAELGHATTLAFATYLGVERGTLDAWLNGRAFPPVRHIIKLRDEHGITLDWIFLDDPSGLSYARAIRLQALVEGMDVPPAEAGEPESVPVDAAPTSEMARRPRTRKKAATS